MKGIRLNTPYTKAYDGEGNLINEILFGYRSLGPNRRQRRIDSGISSSRPFSNKKGRQIVITKYGPFHFLKTEKIVRQGYKNTRLETKILN
ncbi:hypothetical protein Calle1_80 [Cellulophaga phage Calle_1]|uniref:Uncharacterized protein n=1 Tax=Cellulophaga phage Calle_1 TaxID=2745643 RepID=A0A8E4ZKV5_9CAUD|nr:hypothetical protein M1M22_gp035 [Cellulophaga phage Calle_1]QQV89735.1 hypothetical protein Calle1_80 [Cellulophaga phage Calle_1]QQV89854.1 hypothetical protein Calle2_80 [Cellulophaga phage Calle_2]QQV89865.1 hypothetical protein Calle3_80 [Cellulophaga phage Calle_3]